MNDDDLNDSPEGDETAFDQLIYLSPYLILLAVVGAVIGILALIYA